MDNQEKALFLTALHVYLVKTYVELINKGYNIEEKPPSIKRTFTKFLELIEKSENENKENEKE